LGAVRLSGKPDRVFDGGKGRDFCLFANFLHVWDPDCIITDSAGTQLILYILYIHHFGAGIKRLISGLNHF
jgi:hypothetical protein